MSAGAVVDYASEFKRTFVKQYDEVESRWIGENQSIDV